MVEAGQRRHDALARMAAERRELVISCLGAGLIVDGVKDERGGVERLLLNLNRDVERRANRGATLGNGANGLANNECK